MVQLEVYTQLQRTWFMEWSIMDDVLVTACHLNCCCVDTVATWLDECYTNTIVCMLPPVDDDGKDDTGDNGGQLVL